MQTINVTGLDSSSYASFSPAAMTQFESLAGHLMAATNDRGGLLECAPRQATSIIKGDFAETESPWV